MMDGELEKVIELLPTIVCNTTSTKEHVAEAGRKIRVVKEHNRGVVNTLPFTYIPRRMKIEFIYFVKLWLNVLPVKSGVYETLSPREILLRWRMDAKKNCRDRKYSTVLIHIHSPAEQDFPRGECLRNTTLHRECI